MAQPKTKLRGQRATTSLYFLTLLIGFPLCFTLLQGVTAALLESIAWDNAACNWLDTTFRIPESAPSGASLLRQIFSGSFCQWITDIITLVPTLWTIRFLGGAIEESRHTYQVTGLEVIEIFFRWISFSVILALCIPLITTVFYRTLVVLAVWEPIALLVASTMCLFLLFWCYQYPNRRLSQVTKVYQFKRLKHDEISAQ